MRPLTFSGFTRRYVADLSLSDTNAIYPLVQEAVSRNPRLREPLFLYAVSCGKTKTLLSASKRTPYYDEYCSLLGRYGDSETMTAALQNGDPELPEGYRKVWQSYLSVSQKHARDVRVKELIRRKATDLQREKGVSTYRLCKELGLNNANVNAWMKHGSQNKISLENARRILGFLEQLQRA